jgi:hypothetical protein
LRVSGDIVLDTTEPQFRVALKKAVDEVERTEDAGRVLVVELSFCDINMGEYKPQDINIDSMIRFLQSYRVEMGK